ncbi:hypothetical protein B0H34DRAFT_796056 [Crassisporium funariophilum]|nr:hypothetical protein B0H34DRAFT_796056 [Crassisporium funariophilum]
MGFQIPPFPRNIIQDPAAGDFRAFYPYTPNEVKHRKRTTSAQLKVLERIFKQDTKPNAALRNDLAAELEMTARGVQVWFQNRRAKEKIKAGKYLPGSKGPGAPSSTSPIDLPKQEIKDETLADSLLSPTDDSFDAFSHSSSPSITSPPQLHLITDASNFSWQNSPVDPPDSASFISRPINNNNDLYPYRRGSLPVNAFPPPEPSPDTLANDSFDPLVRRRSVDASLQRLHSNPFASLARAKNSALYGPGFGVSQPGRHHQLNRLPYTGYPTQRRGLSQLATMPQHASLRRLSMDSRSTRFPSRLNQSPSPSPLTPYNAVVRASLPDHHLYAVTSRSVASPIPGPLPSPGFSFGAASTSSMTSPSSGDSERNSPDSLRSFTFRGDDEDGAISPSSYDAYSRFGSIASIATSESSINSSYFSEIGGQAEHLAGDVRAEDRRDSCASGQFLGLMSGLDVGSHIEHMPLNLPTYSPHEDYAFARQGDGVELIGANEMHHRHHQQQQQQHHQAEGSYPSPASTISPRGSPHVQDAPTSSVPISTSSELAFALESKPSDQAPSGNRQEPYMTYGDHHQNHSETSSAGPLIAHGHSHSGADHTASDQEGVPAYYSQQHETEAPQQQSNEGLSAPGVYQHQHVHQQQEPECNSVPARGHGHYVASSYSTLADAYSDHRQQQHQQQQQQQLDYARSVSGGHGVGGSIPVYPASAYGGGAGAEGLSLGLAGVGVAQIDNVIQNVESFGSYST